jgi:peptidoglycan/xylan/chitin deacetylase (PgdA/CDA1 family)
MIKRDAETSMSGRWRQGRGFRIVVAAALAVLASTGLVASPAHAATTTVVSLTFDDGHASQYAVRTMLQSRGMVGTYYINSAMVGTSSYYMTWPQIHDVAAAGNEIGGHTLHHTNLTTVSATTAKTEVCDDRTSLINQGFSPLASFAYPEAAYNSTAEQIVRDCGYTSARGVGDVSCSGCPYAETMPPLDAFALRTPDGITTSTTLANLQSYVTNAETHGGGWVILTFHGICDNQCTNVNSMSTSIFTAFLDWLAPRSANGTVVRTVGQAMNVPPPGPDTTPPTTSIACNGGTCSTWLRPSVTVTLSATDVGGSGVDHIVYTTDGSDPTVSGKTYTGPFTVAQTTTVRYYSVDKAQNAEAVRSQLVQVDGVAPSVTLTASPNPVARGGLVTLTASASDAASGVARVTFVADGAQLGTDTTAPYQFSWSTRKMGQHTITATAYDVAGNSAVSAPVTVTVTR